MKKKVIAKMRYWNFNYLGVLTSPQKHNTFIDLISTLDDWFGTTIHTDEPSIYEQWERLLVNLNRCTLEQLEFIDKQFKNV
jgi:hypothetical protein